MREQHAAAQWGADGLLNSRGVLFVAHASAPPRGLARLSGPEGTQTEVMRRYLAMQERLAPSGLAIAADAAPCDAELTEAGAPAGAGARAVGGSGGDAVGTYLFMGIGAVALLSIGLGAWRRRSGPGAAAARQGHPSRLRSASGPAAFADGHGEQADVPPTRFGDVAGLDEAVDALAGLVGALRDPGR